MIILGINAFGENPSSCLVIDGVLRAFCQEDRFTRLKISAGHFPTHSLGWCLRDANLNLGDIGKIAVSWDCTKYPWRMLRHLAGMKLRAPRTGGLDLSSIRHTNPRSAAGLYLLEHTPAVFEQKIRDHLRDAGHKGAIPPIVFVPHHEAHAFQAFYQSPFEEAAVLVADGSGEEKAVSGYHFDANGYRECFSLEIPQSLGWYYSAFTAYLGFHANRDEGKLMGLAALGTARRQENPWLERLDRVLRVGPETFHLDPSMVKFAGNEHHPRFTDKLRRFILSHDPRLEPIGVGERVEIDGLPQPRYLLPAYVDLAFAVQDRLEEALLSLVRRLRRNSNSPRLCLAGGVFMNCKANGRILDDSGVDELFVHPACSDDGSAIGAAFHAARAYDRLLPNPLHHTQLGPSFSDTEIEEVLQVAGVPYTTPSDVAARTAELLAAGKLCGWFQGGLEMGARALGGRSIVACPHPREVSTRVNARVKFREPWRPYCPSLKASSSSKYIERTVEAPFMIVARTATEALAARGPATVHVDGTVRPQTVREEVLPLWHHLLSETEHRTGDPVLLNTSFNVRGEPVVCTPNDAVRCFYGSGLDALAMGSFLIVKRETGGPHAQ